MAPTSISITPVLLFGALLAAQVATDAGTLSDQAPAAPAKTAASSPSGRAKSPYLYTNRLIREKSPYLLLHAHNPVNWYPWGEEAFAKARRENKPIFLSVGYYTCHWCHVMERESYSNPAIAELLNRSFVSIKVDREERPDIDNEYMTFVEATTGSGGWPMNVFLTPDLKPFFGGTYFPPDDKYGHAGLRTLLPRIADLWAKQHDKILRSADEITQKLQQAVDGGASSGKGLLQASLLDKAYEQIRLSYDAVHGGFGEAPLFPRPVVPDFLLRYWSRTGKKDALDMVLNNLRAMAAGGRPMAGTPLREDALRPSSAGHALHRSLPVNQRRVLRRWDARHSRLHAARDAQPGGSFLLRIGRRQPA
jgi:Protein of unknown function, DUF255